MENQKVNSNDVRLETRALLKEFREKKNLEEKSDENQGNSFQKNQNTNTKVNEKEGLKEKTQEIRSSQLRIGRFIEENYNKLVKDEEEKRIENLSQLKRKIGRPKKPEEDKVKFIAMKLSNDYVSFLKGIEGIGGFGLKIRKIIDEYKVFKKREKTHIELLKKYIEKIDHYLSRYTKNYERANKIEENSQMILDIEKNIKDLFIIMNILSYEINDLKKILSQKEFNTLTFAINWKSNRKEV